MAYNYYLKIVAAPTSHIGQRFDNRVKLVIKYNTYAYNEQRRQVFQM